MGLLSTAIGPRLLAAFPDQPMVLLDSASPFVRISPKWPEFGPLEILDDGDEVTICFGNFSHVHCGLQHRRLTEAEWTSAVGDDVIDYLRETFSDRIRFWCNKWGGGCCAIDKDLSFFERRKGTRRGTWSAPLPSFAD